MKLFIFYYICMLLQARPLHIIHTFHFKLCTQPFYLFVCLWIISSLWNDALLFCSMMTLSCFTIMIRGTLDYTEHCAQENGGLKIACFVFLASRQTQLASRCVTSVNQSTRAPTACSAKMDTTTPTVSACHAPAMGTPSQAAHPASATQTPDTAWTAPTTLPGLTANPALLVSLGTPLPGTAHPSVNLWGFIPSTYQYAV